LYSALRENTANALNETQCHTNRCVFKSRRNWQSKSCRSFRLARCRHTDACARKIFPPTADVLFNISVGNQRFS